MPKRRPIDRDAAKRTGSILSGAQGRLGNDALEILAGRASGEALSEEQWQTVGNYLAALTIESYSSDEDDVQLCPRCGCILARQGGNYWICSGALYEAEAILDDGSMGDHPVAERVWPLAEQPEEVRQMWQEQCGGCRVYLPSEAPRRKDFRSLIPDQLTWALTFDELVARMRMLYREARYSLRNSTVRPKHVRAELNKLREQQAVRILIGTDGQARFQRVA